MRPMLGVCRRAEQRQRYRNRLVFFNSKDFHTRCRAPIAPKGQSTVGKLATDTDSSGNTECVDTRLPRCTFKFFIFQSTLREIFSLTLIPFEDI